MKPKRILLMRHAKVSPQWRGRFLGASDPPLCQQGREQALCWREQLSALPLRRVFCSDQARSRQTAEIIAAERGLAMVLSPALREVNLGTWEGLSTQEVRQRYPEEYARRGKDLAGFPAPQGESLSGLAARVLPEWQAIRQTEDDLILLVTHAGVLRVILCAALGMDLNRALSWRLDHASLCLLDDDGDHFTLLASNLPCPPQGALAQFFPELSTAEG